MFTWLWALGVGKRVAIYCSDVSGAFDRVSSKILLAKLEAFGVHPDLLRLLRSWLADRSAQVCIDGCLSSKVTLRNMVFQGTVLGPPLWNIFFSDAQIAVREAGFEEEVFADDLNCFKVVNGNFGDVYVNGLTQRCQASLHRWGQANQVVFEPDKESMHILGRYSTYGGPFKMLNVVVYPRLSMREAAYTLSMEAGWRISSLLRVRRFYDTRSLIQMFKCQILSSLEGATPALYQASPSVLRPIDQIQEKFLEELGIPSTTALLEHNLAPLSMRRDIAMLGILYKVLRGIGPKPIRDLFS